MLARVVKRAPSPSRRPSSPSASLPIGSVGSRVGGLDVNKLLRILPQRPPALMLDRVTALEPRKSARGIKCVSANEPAVRGHFPSAPVLPAVLCLEALSQLMCVLIYASDGLDPSFQQYCLAGVEKAKFRQPIVPGDRIELSIRVLHHRSNIWKCSASAMVDEILCVEAELLAAIQDCEELE
jgi:3-hydroxyacyl-[acyl-carrier-protein] dehydratase